VLGHEGGHLLHLERREVCGQQVRGHHDRAFAERQVVVAHADQARDHALADVLHVGPTLAEVRILDRREGVRVLGHHAADGLEGVAAAPGLVLETPHQPLVLEDLDVRVEDGREVGAEAVADVVAHVVQLAQRAFERAAQVLQLAAGLGIRSILDLVEVHAVCEEVDGADRDAATSRCRASRCAARRGTAATPERASSSSRRLRRSSPLATTARSWAFITTGAITWAQVSRSSRSASENSRRSRVWTTSAPIVKRLSPPRTRRGAAISEAKRSSPVSGK
jgi:hypothetical protein